MATADPYALEREWREQQERERAERERQLPPPSSPSLPRPPVPEAGTPVPAAPYEREERLHEGRFGPPLPPPPKKNWWMDPSEREAVRERAEQIAVREYEPPMRGIPTAMPGPPPRGRTGELEQAERQARFPLPSDFIGTAPSYMGATTMEGEPLSWADLQTTRAAGELGLMTDRGALDLTRLSTVPAPPSMEQLRATGWQPIETRPEPGSPEYQALGQQQFMDRIKGYFSSPELEMERPGYWEEIVRPSGVIESVGAGRWAHELMTPETEERIGVMFSPKAFWRYQKAGSLQNVLGLGEAVADIGVTALQQTAYWVERGVGEFMLRNMMTPDEFRRQQEVMRQRSLFPELPGRPEEREQKQEEYTALYRALYETNLSDAGRHRAIAEVARMAYSPLPNQTRAVARIAAGEDPNRVVAEEMDPLSEMIGQIALDPMNWAMGPAASRFMGKLKAARNTAYWMNEAAQVPDAIKFMGLESKWSRAGARFGIIPEYLDPLALTRGARASKAGDSALTIVHHLASRYADDPGKLAFVLRGLDDQWDNVARLVGIEPESEGGRLAHAILKDLFSEGQIDNIESLSRATKPVQATLEGAEEVAKPFSMFDFIDEITEPVYSHANDAYKVELDRYAKWNIPGRLSMATKSLVSNVYLGLNPGYLWRNAWNNTSTVLVDDLSTFRSIGKVGDDFSEQWRLSGVPGEKRGLGTMAEIDKGDARLLHKPAAMMEDQASSIVMRHQAELGWNRGWRDANAAYFPKGSLKTYLPDASDETIEFWERLQRSSLNPQEFRRKADEIFDLMQGKPPIAGGATDALEGSRARLVEALEGGDDAIADYMRSAASGKTGDFEYWEATYGLDEAIAESKKYLEGGIANIDERLAGGLPKQPPTLDELAAQAREAEGLGQAEMFTEGQDLPLFSETPIEGEMGVYRPPEEIGTAQRFPGMECPVCFGQGVYGGKSCVCGGTGLREVAEETIENLRPRYPIDVSQFDPNGTIPHNVIAETQEIADEFVRNGDEAEAMAALGEYMDDVHTRTNLSAVRDGLWYDTKKGTLVVGPPLVGMDDLPEPIHYFKRGYKKLEGRVGVDKAAAQPMYAEIIEEVSGAAPAVPTSRLTYASLGDEEKIHYVKKLLKMVEDKGEELRDFERAFLNEPTDNLLLYTRSPADPLPGPFSEDELLALIPEFRKRALDSKLTMVENERLAQLMGFEGDNAAKQAQQLSGTLYQYGMVSDAETRTGLRWVRLRHGDEAAVTAEGLAQGRADLLENWMGKRWPRRVEAHTQLAASDQSMLTYHQQSLAFLKGEADDIPVLRDLVSPLQAERMRPESAREIIAFVDNIKERFEGKGALASMTDEELDLYASATIGQGRKAVEAELALWDEMAKEALPPYDVARAFQEVGDVRAMRGSLPTKKDITTGSKARRIVKTDVEGNNVITYSKHQRGVIENFRYDEWVMEQEGKYPEFYRMIRGELTGGGYEADVFRRAVDMRLDPKSARAKFLAQLEAYDEHAAEITSELVRRGMLEPEALAEALPVVEAGADAERVATVNSIRDKLASGEYRVEDIQAAFDTGHITKDDAAELTAFNKRHWDLQAEQNTNLKEEIAQRQRKALETEPLGPRRTVRPTERALGQLPLEGEVGLSREFALMEAMDAGPTTFGGSRITDAFMAQERYVDDYIWKVQNGLVDGAKKPPPAPPGFFTDDTKDAIMRWGDEVVDPAREGAKIIAESNAVAIRDFALLDYRQRKNLDLWIAMGFPYHYWYTRSGWNWLQRMATKPAAFNVQTRMQQYVREQNKDLPTRLRDSVGVPAPILKEWMGDKLYIDPSRNIFAFLNLYPWAALSRYDYNDPVEAQNGYQEWGDLFDRVQMRPFLYIDLPRRWLSGEGDETYYQAPLTAGIKGTSALMREAGILSDMGEDLFIPPGGWNIEGQVREWTGMPRAYFTEETYWPAQHLAMMVANGEMDEETAWDTLYNALVMGETDSQEWQQAYQRGGVQRGVSQFGSFWLGQPLNIYPRGEELMRKWSAELDKLGYMPGEREGGTAAERWEYLDEHPALGLRSAVFSYMGPKAWMFKNDKGVVSVDEFKAAEQEFAQGGGGEAALGRRYQMRKYGQELGETQILKAEMENQLIEDGMVPGTRAFKVFDDWFREQVEEPLHQRYEPYFSGGAGEAPFKASPEERLAWMQEQRVKALGEVYYDIKPEQYADAEGEIDWDTFSRAREAAIQSLPPEARAEFTQYLHRTWIPEEEAMVAVEAAVYDPLWELIGAIGDAEGEEKKLLQEELDALEEISPEAAEAALLDAIDEIMSLHPEWGEEERNRLLDFAIPSLETWRRSTQKPRKAFEDALQSFYWGLDKGTRRITHDQEWAQRAGVPESYLGSEFEAFQKANPEAADMKEAMDEISDEQLLQWLAQTGQLSMLAEEGFPVPGEPLRGVLARIPGYEERVEGVEYDFAGVEGRAGAALTGEPTLPFGLQPPRQMGLGEGAGPTTVSVREGVPGEAEPDRTEALEAGMREAVADVAVQGEELSQIELVDPTFQVPAEGVVDEMTQAYAEMDLYWAAKDAGQEPPEWSPLMEKWFGDPDSPKSLFWKAYKEWRAPEENNPLGWGLLPPEVKENPFVKMVFDSMDEGTPDADEDTYLEARLAIEEYIEAHGEELIQARDEYVGYIATLNEELEELQDQYYEFAQGSQERRDFLKAHPELSDYWDGKRAYKDAHPVMVKYYFPPKEGEVAYQPRGTYGGWGGGGGRRKGVATAAQGPKWDAFLAAAGPEIAQVLIGYWTGRSALSAADRRYLEILFKAHPYGAASFEAWLDLLRGAWQGSLPKGGEYDIPMRQRGVIVSPESQSTGFNAPGRPPTRVRYLRT